MIKLADFKKEEFPYIEYLSVLLDVGITEDSMDAEGEIDETPEHTVPCYALANKTGAISPFFDSYEDLNDFLKTHVAKFEGMAKQGKLALVNDEGEVV
jgi:hypothetical protein